MGHGTTLNKARNRYQAYERAANNLLARIKPLETIRVATLSGNVHDQLYDYDLPTDYRSLIGVYPQSGRIENDGSYRVFADYFDRRKRIDDKRISIEGSDGTKKIRINWDTRTPKTLSDMNSYDQNGTWTAVATASGVATDTLFKFSGSGSVKVDIVATGDGIENTTLDALDLTDEDEVAHARIAFYIKDAADLANLNSVTFIWGNDLTTNYWTGVAQTTQADGSAFRVGWNVILVPWSTATETGTVAPATIDSARVTFSVDAAISDIRVDNILFSIGSPFEIKYHSKFLFQTSAGVYITRPTIDTDQVVLDNDAVNIFLYEALSELAQQIEGEDSLFDIQYAQKKLNGDGQSPDPIGRIGLYAQYRAEYPSQTKKAVSSYGMNTNFRRFK